MYYLVKSIENRPYIIAKGPKSLCKTILAVDSNQVISDLIGNYQVVDSLFALPDDEYYEAVSNLLSFNLDLDSLCGTIGPKGENRPHTAAWLSYEFGEDADDPFVSDILLEIVNPLTDCINRFLVRANYTIHLSETQEFVKNLVENLHKQRGELFFAWLEKASPEDLAKNGLICVETCGFDDVHLLMDGCVTFESICFEAYVMMEYQPQTGKGE